MQDRQTLVDRNPEDVPQTRADWATARLRSAILFAEIAPGEEIRETVLAKRWGISSTPLREALRRLAAEGLVVQRPQRIARAAELLREQCIELYEIRLVVEVLAIRLSLANRPVERIAQAERLLEQMREVEASAPFDPFGYERVHREFHYVLVCDCGSVTLLETLSSLWDRSMRFRYAAQSTATIPGVLFKSHRKLLRSWKAGDARKASLGFEEHILPVLAEVLSPHEIERVRRMRSEIPAMGRDLVASGLVSEPVGEIVAVGTDDRSSDG